MVPDKAKKDQIFFRCDGRRRGFSPAAFTGCKQKLSAGCQVRRLKPRASHALTSTISPCQICL